MGFPLTLPQAPVIAGESGHLNDHNNIEAGLLSLWQATMESFYNVQAPPYNAAGNGVADDTAAIQAAINAANTAGGGVVCIPQGTYLVTPSGSPAVALTLLGGSAGYQNVRIVGAGATTSVIKKNGNGTLLQLSGATAPSTGATHCRWCTVDSLGFDGGSHTGVVFQCYYADNIFMRDVNVNNNADIILDSAEFWDSRFYNVVFGGSGSTAANTDAPNVYLRCSAASSGFGSSTGTTNMIVFHGCRWEAFLTGALKVAQGPGSSSGVNSVFVTDCKMETSQLNGGNHISVDLNARAVFVRGLYAYSGGFYSGYSTAQDMISWSGQDSAISDVLLSSGGSATVANGITLNSTVAAQAAVARNVYGTYTTLPTGVHVNQGTATGNFVIDNCHSNATDPSDINAIQDLLASASTVNMMASSVAGDSAKRWVMNAGGGMSWGSGSGSADVVATRTAAGVWSWTSGIIDPQHGTKTTTAAAVLTPTFASGTAAQLTDTTRDYMVYLTVGTAGTITVAIGPTSTPANTLISAATATGGEMVSFRLPAAWFVKVTLVTATLATQTAVGC